MQTKERMGPSGQIRIPRGALVVVCDSERSLFLTNIGSATEPSLAQFDAMEQDNPSDGEQTTDRPGRQRDDGQGQRSAMAEPDHHELEKKRFAHHLAQILQKASLKGAFQDLVLVAPPAMLGELRNGLHPDVQQKLRAEVDKDLTNHSRDEIQSILLSL